MANIKNLKPFKPGQSGNPNGRPKKLDSLQRIIEQVMNEPGKGGKPAIYNIVHALIQKAEKGDIRAIQEILDRYYGKPKSSLEIESNINSNYVDIKPKEWVMTDGQVNEIIEALKPPDNLDS